MVLCLIKVIIRGGSTEEVRFQLSYTVDVALMHFEFPT